MPLVGRMANSTNSSGLTGRMATKTSPTNTPALVGRMSTKSNDNVKTATLPDFLGGGAYNLDKDPNKLINTGHTTYGEVPTKKGSERADIFPVSLGGANSNSKNITYEKFLPDVATAQSQGKPLPVIKTSTDKYLNDVVLPQYKSGKISLREAQVMATSFLRNEQEGLTDKMSNIDLGGKVGEFADSAVSLFGGLKNTIKNGVDKTKSLLNTLPQDVSRKPIIEELGSPKQPIKASMQPNVFKVAKTTAKAIAPIVQAPQRALVSAGLEPASGILSLIKNKDINAEYTPKSSLEKTVFGNEPIKGLFQQTKDLQNSSENILNKSNINKDISKGASMAIAPFVVAGTKAMDLFPLGGEENTAKKIASSNNADEILNIIKPLFKDKPADELSSLSKELVKVSKPEEVKSLIAKTVKNKVIPIAKPDEATALKNAAQEAKFKMSEVQSNINARKMLLDAKLNKFTDPKENRLAMELLQHPENQEEILKQSKNPQAIKDASKAYKDYTDYLYNIRSTTDSSKMRYDSNFYHTQWDLTKPEDAKHYTELINAQPRNYQGGYTKSKVFKDLNEGEEAGFTPAFKTLKDSASHLHDQNLLGLPNDALLKTLKDNKVGDHFSNTDFHGAVKPNIPGMDGTYFSKPLHNELKNLEPSALSKTPGVKQVLKVNKNLKDLALSLANFHSLNISKKVMGVSNNPLEVLKGAKAFLSPEYFNKELERNISDGVVDWASKSGMNTFSYQGLGGDLVSKGKYNPINILHKATFDRQIPLYAMDLARAAMKKGVNPESPEGRALGKQINALLGSINWKTMDGKFLNNPEVRTSMNLGLLAPSFSIGKIQNVKAALTKGGEAGNFARRAIIGDAIVTGLMAELGTKAVTGKFNNPKDIVQNDILDPNSPLPYKSPDGKMLSAGFPGTDISDAARALEDPKHALQSRTAPIVSLGSKLMTGEDYYGNPLKPAGSTHPVLDTASNVIQSELPIGVNQSLKLAQGKQNLATTALNIGGMKVKTSADDPTSQYYKQFSKSQIKVTRTPEEQKVYDELQKSRADFKPTYDKIQELKNNGKTEEAQKMVDNLSDNDYNVYKSIKKSDTLKKDTANKIKLLSTFNHIQDLIKEGKNDEAQTIVDTMTDDEYKAYKAMKKASNVK
jgi:hypothetical protein